MEHAPEWILVGIIGRAHGTRGEVLVRSLTDWEERFMTGSKLYLARAGREDEREPVTVIAGRSTAKGQLIFIEGYESREDVRGLSGASLFIPSSQLRQPVSKGFYGFQVEGCSVYAGKRLVGEVKGLRESRANPFLEVERTEGGQEILIPFVKEVIQAVDIDGRRIEIVEDFTA